VKGNKAFMHELKVALSTEFSSHKADHEFKANFLGSSYAISYLTSRLLVGMDIVKEAMRKWKEGKVYAPFLDFLNFTMDCGDGCPIAFARAQECYMNDERTRLYFDFTAPVINETLRLLEADPFDIMLKKDNSTCKIRYNGPENAVLSVKEDCVYGINVKKPVIRDLILSPSRGCKPQSQLPESTKYFRLDECKPSHSDDAQEFIQIKPHHGQYHVYCFGSNLTLNNHPQACPSTVFLLPTSATFKINEMEFNGSKIDVVHQEANDPLFTLKANWHLQPSLNMTDMLRRLDEAEKGVLTYKDNTDDSTNHHLMIIYGLSVIVIVLLFIFACFFKTE